MKAILTARASASLLMLALTALAADAPAFSRVALLLPACETPGLGATELRDAAALDLRDAGLRLAPAGELSAATDVLVHVATDCAPESPLTLNAQYGEERHTRRVDLSELPQPQRARALSLAIAELLALFGHPPAATPPAPTEPAPATEAPAASAPQAEPVVAAPKAATRPPPTPAPSSPPARGSTADAKAIEGGPKPPAPSWSLSLGPELRFFDATLLWGGRAGVHYGAWSAGLDVLRAEQSVAAGRVTTLVLHGSAAYSRVLLGGPERAQLEAGPRLGFGRAFMSASPTTTAAAHDAQDVYLDAALAARYSLRLSSALRVGLGAELGYARGPIGYADDVVVARTGGPFASVLLDASVHP